MAAIFSFYKASIVYRKRTNDPIKKPLTKKNGGKPTKSIKQMNALISEDGFFCFADFIVKVMGWCDVLIAKKASLPQ